MAITWSSLYSNTETQGDLKLTTTIHQATVSGGYLLRAQTMVLYKNKVPTMPKTALVFVPLTQPSSIAISNESSDTSVTYSDTDLGNFTVDDKTDLITPKDGSNNPIGTGRIYMTTRLIRPSGTGLSGSVDIALEYVP